MKAFRFEATDPDGRIEKGVLEADGARSARAQLRARGLIPLAVEPVVEAAGGRSGARVARLSVNELALATRQLASLLAARLPLAVALSAVVEQTDQPAARALLSAVRSEIVAGARLADALGRFPRQFPAVYRATVAAGEEAGDLALVMERLAEYIEQRELLRGKVLGAFLYPAVVTLVALAIVLFLMTYVVPQVVGVFEQTRQTLPWPTRALLAVSAGVRIGGPWLLALLPIVYLVVRNRIRQPAVRVAWHRLLLRLPMVGRMLRDVDAARFAGTLAILVESGVPVLRALEAARATLGNEVLAQAVTAAMSQVREGGGLARALGAAKAFPPMLIHLIASGETTGRLAAMLERAAALQSREVERRAMFLTTVLEPALILLMGVVVLAIVLAVLMPIIELNQLVR